MGAQTRPAASAPPTAKGHAPTKPATAARPKRKTTAKQPPKAAAPRPQHAAKPKPKPKPGATATAQAQALRPQRSQIRQQQRPARRPPTVTAAAANTFMAEPAEAKARRTLYRHHSKPAPEAYGPPPTGPEQRQGQSTASPPPYQHPMSAHVQQMRRYRRPHWSQPNPEAETVRAYQLVCVRPLSCSPRTPTAQDYQDSPMPTTATSPHDPATRTHAHTSAQGHCPAHGQWWQGSTHTQLWELQKLARAEPSLEGPLRRPRRGSAENCRLQPAGGWMPQAAWGAMLAIALHPQKVHPHSLPAPQDHPYDLKRLP